MAKLVNVAVYGSLRHGQWNHYNLQGSVFVGKGRLPTDADGHPLHHLWHMTAGYPALLPRGDGDTTRQMQPALVEVYAVDGPTLDRLDRLEGVPYLYRREAVEVRLDGGEVVVAQLYVWGGRRDLDGRGGWPESRRIPGGDWVAVYGNRAR
jgi:gamma-glutamylcyclotransferase (GGCT)/AIG2-like uncharacterized protein YtfP